MFRVRILPRSALSNPIFHKQNRCATTLFSGPTKRNTMLLDESTTFEAMPVRANMIPSLQQPAQQVLWIGCSDSCYQETKTLDLLPDEMLVHRNLGNMLIKGDMSSEVTINHAVANLMVSRSLSITGSPTSNAQLGQAHSRVWSLRVWYCPN